MKILIISKRKENHQYRFRIYEEYTDGNIKTYEILQEDIDRRIKNGELFYLKNGETVSNFDFAKELQSF